jgi:thiaminase/transcriptional activator TenA
MQTHRFVQDIEADALPREVLGRYVVSENNSVETAILIVGDALPKAPGGSVPAAVIDFERGMLGIAQSGRYLDILTIMLSAEWMFATWCSAECASEPRSAGSRMGASAQ